VPNAEGGVRAGHKRTKKDEMVVGVGRFLCFVIFVRFAIFVCFVIFVRFAIRGQRTAAEIPVTPSVRAEASANSNRSLG
jgi:hypothetical protein